MKYILILSLLANGQTKEYEGFNTLETCLEAGKAWVMGAGEIGFSGSARCVPEG